MTPRMPTTASIAETATNPDHAKAIAPPATPMLPPRKVQGREQDKTEAIRRPALRTVGPRRRRARKNQASNGGQHEHDVEPEDQPPPREVRERAANERPDAETQHQES